MATGTGGAFHGRDKKAAERKEIVSVSAENCKGSVKLESLRTKRPSAGGRSSVTLDVGGAYLCALRLVDESEMI